MISHTCSLILVFVDLRIASCYLHPAVSQEQVRDCSDELTIWNEDTNNYDLAWKKLIPGDPKPPTEEREPWTYRNAYENMAVPTLGRLQNIWSSGGGGYILPMGKTSNNSRIVLNYMDYFNWIDSRTRVVYIDFTTYTQAANVFTVTTLIVEISSTGVFIPSYKIYSGQLFIRDTQVLIVVIIATGVFTCFVIIFAIKEVLKMIRASVKKYFKIGWSLVDLLIAVIGIMCVISIIFRTYYVGLLMNQLDAAAANDFVSFQYAAEWDAIYNYFVALLVFLTTLKAFRLLTFRQIFKEWDQVLSFAWGPLMGIYVLILCCTLLFGILFFLILGKYEEQFSKVTTSCSLMLWHSTRKITNFDSGFLTHVSFAGFFYSLFLGYSSYLMISVFTTVLCVHIKFVHLQPVRSHYHLRPFIKSLVKPNTVVPAPPVAPLPQPVTLKRRRAIDLILPPYIDEVRLQGMKREALQVLTGLDYAEETALNIAYIVVSKNAGRPGTDFYNLVEVNSERILTEESKVKRMKEIADIVVEERNSVLKEQLKVKMY